MNPKQYYRTGDIVQVRSGIKDADFPDITIGGWVGEITEVDDQSPVTYMITWNQETLRLMHPVFKRRCERDGLDIDKMCLDHDSIEPFKGGPVKLDQQEKIKTAPLSMKNEDDRIRSVFGLTSDDPIPSVNSETLTAYCNYLEKNLVFPFDATWTNEALTRDRSQPVKVIGLEEVEDEFYGIFCNVKLPRGTGEVPLVEIQKVKDKMKKQLVEDYSYWFTNYC